MTTRVSVPLIVTAAITAPGTLLSGRYSIVDATSGSFALDLPTTAEEGVQVVVQKTDSTASTVTINGSINGATSSRILSSLNETAEFIFDATLATWRAPGVYGYDGGTF